MNQIRLDLHRTFPYCPLFEKHNYGQGQLERVLLAYAKYDLSGYVQGMNFVAGSLLFHCSEEIAFSLFVDLMDSYELSQIYSKEFSGLLMHTEMIERLIFKQLPEIYAHFVLLYLK